jgi:putative transport protein
MEEFVAALNAQPVLVIAAAIALGILLGNLSVAGFSLGASGVLFVAMAFGHLGVKLPAVVGDLGVALFVYSVGLQAGPHFIRSVRHRGWSFVMLAIVTLIAAWLVAMACARTLAIDAPLSTGMYAGALTSTPALAAALQTLDDPRISVGFGVAYPFGVVGVILFVQLVPRIFRVDWQQELARAKASDAAEPIEVAWFEITNPQIDGKTLRDLELAQPSGAIISRILDKYVALPPQAETHLALGQHVRVVGTAAELAQLELLLGPRAGDFHEPRSAIRPATVVVTEEKFCGRTLAEMSFRERFGVTITRMWRDDFEFVPTGRNMLEFGDEIRVVGDADDCARVTSLLGHRPEKLHETRFLAVGFGLLAGVLIGLVPLPIGGGYTLRLGLAGGPLLAGLIAGHFGRIGPVNFRMPPAARMFMNQIGLILFLAAAGLHAGESFWDVISGQGATMLVAATLITIIPLFVAFAVARYWFGWDELNVLGAICGAMTCTPGLGIVSKLTDSSIPATAYVAVYPVALVFVSILAPLLGTLLAAWAP